MDIENEEIHSLLEEMEEIRKRCGLQLNRIKEVNIIETKIRNQDILPSYKIHEIIEPHLNSIKYRADTLAERFNSLRSDFGRITKNKKANIFLDEIYPSDLPEKNLMKILLMSKRAVSFLQRLVLPLSTEEIKKLNNLRKELESSNIKKDYKVNIDKAMFEYESGHKLASALISGRLIYYSIQQIKGEKDEDKIKFLIEKGIIKKDEEDVSSSIIKASRLSRSLLEHSKITEVSPPDEEVLSLLAESIRIAKIVSKLK